jgi:hypothetical protein
MKKDGYDIRVERTEYRINILLVENEAFDGRMIVKAGEREEFLTPWVRKLIGLKMAAGLKGARRLARLLHRCTVFEIENEQKEDGKRKKQK